AAPAEGEEAPGPPQTPPGGWGGGAPPSAGALGGGGGKGEPPQDPPGRGGGGRRPRGRGGVGTSPPDRKSKEWEERRRQNIEKMNEEMEKIAEYERSQRDGLPEKNPVRNFLDDPRRSGPFQGSDRRDGSRRHGRNWGGSDFAQVRAGMERDKSRHDPGPPCSPRGGTDMTLSMTGRERAEYLRWKQERDRIDRERLARHREPSGQWRREWDAQKPPGISSSRAGITSGGGHEGGSTDAPPPNPPTLGEFLAPPPQRRRRGR
ncbi:LOW QUALITY PROTEIN: coiled-coil domain-containing protein 9, partial [Aegotheles albertisi]